MFEAERNKAKDSMQAIRNGTHGEGQFKQFQKNGGHQMSAKTQHILQLHDERGKLVQQILDHGADEPDRALIQKLVEKDACVKMLLEMEPSTEDYVKIALDKSAWMIFHNVDEGNDNLPFEVMYAHTDYLYPGGFFQCRVEDLGENWQKLDKPHQDFDIGIGVIDESVKAGENRLKYGFDIGFLSNAHGVTYLGPGDTKESTGCPESALIEGDVISCRIDEYGSVIAEKNPGEAPKQSDNYKPSEKKYKIFIGMKYRYQKVTLAQNTSFDFMCKDRLGEFPKIDVRVYVTSINEGSPRYAEGVANGGKHLLRDGTLVRRIREDGRCIVNYEAGCDASIYDAKVGANLDLEMILPNQLLRNRLKLSGNLVSVTRRGIDEYAVVVKSLLSGHEENFLGTNAQWQEERDRLLSSGERFVIDLPTANGMVQTNNLLIAGTKCKTICNMIYRALTAPIREQSAPAFQRIGSGSLKAQTQQLRKDEKAKSPAVLLLGGDRSQSIGSISGALRAYDDLCVLFFDAHNDFRDPSCSQYPIVHGSPLFFLLQSQLRDAIKEYKKDPSAYSDETRDAIRFINSTREGRLYWEDLQNSEVGYRGFNWLEDSKKINPQRMAFIGLRQTEWEAGSSVGSPLVGLFTNLLGLKKGTYSHDLIKSEGVKKIFQRIIDQFRSTFDKGYLDKKDKEHPKGRWIPPIFVSWDVDSIDPKDCPCTIFQEPNGLTSEECLAFSDEIASTRSLVLMETIEFNPDLWEGYRDEPAIMTINEFEAGPFARAPREPTDKNKHRLDLQLSISLIQDMIQRAFKLDQVPLEH